MVTHTLATLGPKVLASRMVRDYVQKLYAPAAISSRAVLADHATLAKELAAYAAKVRGSWSGVRVEHVEASGVGDCARAGHRAVRARLRRARRARPPPTCWCSSRSGRVDHNDRIVAATVTRSSPAEGYDGNRWRYEATVGLDDTGPFGYTVRVLPSHEGLHDPAELGLQALPVHGRGHATD